MYFSSDLCDDDVAVWSVACPFVFPQSLISCVELLCDLLYVPVDVRWLDECEVV